jgi:hypothetical protein
MEIEAKILVECEGRLTFGSKTTFSNSFGNFLPPEAPEIAGFRVYLVGQDSRVNITNHLSATELEELREEYMAQLLAGE